MTIKFIQKWNICVKAITNNTCFETRYEFFLLRMNQKNQPIIQPKSSQDSFYFKSDDEPINRYACGIYSSMFIYTL